MATHTQLPSSTTPRRIPANGLSAAAFASFRRTSSAASRPPRRPEYVPNRIDDPNYVSIFDNTLRNSTITATKKLFIARQLTLLGVDIIEAGFPASSQEDFDAVRSITIEIGNNTPLVEGSHVPVICGLSRCSKEDVDKAWEAVQHAQQPRINVFIPTSKILMGSILRKTPDEVVTIAKETVAYARGLGCTDVQFSADDAGRSDREFLHHILEEVIKAGATTLNISDTFGHTLPDQFGSLIAYIRANITGIENVIISTHCQNFYGHATANTLAGARVGARQLEVSISCFGERSRNASMEEVVRAIEHHRKKLRGGLYTVINSQLINRTSKMIKEHNGALIQPHISASGAHEDGTHQLMDSSSPMKDSDLTRKGFLSFIYTLTNTLFLFYSPINVYSYSYPGSQKALVSYDQTLVKGICFSKAFLCFGSLAMLPFAVG